MDNDLRKAVMERFKPDVIRRVAANAPKDDTPEQVSIDNDTTAGLASKLRTKFREIDEKKAIAAESAQQDAAEFIKRTFDKDKTRDFLKSLFK
jgi:hypothetical protein